MKFFFHYKNKKLELKIKENQTVNDIKKILQNQFQIDLNSDDTETLKIVLEFNGTELNDNWFVTDLGLPINSILKCYVKCEKYPDLFVHIKAQKEDYYIYESDIDPNKWSVLELRVLLQNKLGFPLSIFRLKTCSNTEMFDEKTLDYYNITKRSRLILETWQGWDSLIQNAVKGNSRLFLSLLSSDEFIKQYQMKAGLFIACHYGNYELVKSLMLSGARVYRPVGEHPCRQWCQPDINDSEPTDRIEYLKKEYLRCPVHAAILNGQLKVLNFIGNKCVQALHTKDGHGLPPWRIALHNNHKEKAKRLQQKEVARFLLSKCFGSKIQVGETYSLPLFIYASLKTWAERAKERVVVKHGIGKSSMRKRSFHKGGLVGYKCLIDGYNNNFKDYVNSYERLRESYKFYYYKDEDEKDHGNYIDSYFKSVGLFRPRKTIHFAKIEVKSDRPVPSTYPKWRRVFNKIVFRNKVVKNVRELARLGYEVDCVKYRIKLDVKEDEMKRRKSSIKLPNVKSVSQLTCRSKLSLLSDSKSPSPSRNCRETMKSFEKLRNGLSSTQNAQLLLKQMNGVNTKSWVKQVSLASKLASSNARRLIKRYSVELN